MAPTAAELSARLRAEPVYLVEVALQNGGPTLYLSTRQITVSGQPYEHYIEGVRGIDAEVKRLDSSALNPSIEIMFLNEAYGDPAAPLIQLGETYPFERAAVTIKRTWMDNAGVPVTPETLFKGALDAPRNITRARFSAMCSELEYSLGQAYRDQIVDESIWPDAFEDMGRPLPHVYGSVRIPALRTVFGARTTLAENINATATSFSVTDAERFPASGSITVDAETMTFSRSGNAFTVTRGTGGTTAAAHNLGAVVWEALATYKNVLADHVVKSCSNVYAEMDGALVRVNPADWILSTVGGRSELHVATQFRLADDLNVNLNVTDTIAVKTNSTDTSTENTEKLASGLPYTIIHTDKSTSYYAWNLNLPSAPSGALSGIYVEIGFAVYGREFNGHYGGVWAWYIDGVLVGRVYPVVASGGLNTGEGLLTSSPIYRAKAAWATTVELRLVREYAADAGANIQVCLNISHAFERAKRTIARTGSVGVTADGTITNHRQVDRFHADIQGYADDGSGTYTGTPFALIERPDHVIHHFLVEVMGASASDINTASFSAAGALLASAISGGYKFGVATIEGMNNPARFARDLARQARCVLRRSGGQWHLDYLPDAAPSGVAAVTEAEAVGAGAEPVFERGSVLRIANDITARYERNHSKLRGDSDWNATANAVDAASKTKYGTYERTVDLPAVRSATMASHVLAHMLLQSKTPLLRLRILLPLEYSALVPGDTIELASTVFNGREWYIEQVITHPTYVEITAVEWWA